MKSPNRSDCEDEQPFIIRPGINVPCPVVMCFILGLVSCLMSRILAHTNKHTPAAETNFQIEFLDLNSPVYSTIYTGIAIKSAICSLNWSDVHGYGCCIPLWE